MTEFLVFLLSGLGAGYAGSALQSWRLSRRTYASECAIADLEDQVLRELKKRAGMAHKNLKIEEELLDLVKKPSQPAQPWWFNYITPTEKNPPA